MSSDLDAQRERSLERMLTAARLDRRRGDFEAAWRALDDALLLVPDSPEVLEEMAGLNLDEGEYEAAAQCYRRVLELAPGRTSAEIGLGNATVEAARAAAGEATEQQPDSRLMARLQPGRAALYGALIPGWGHLYATEFGNGLGLLLAALPCWYLVFWGLTTRIGRDLRVLPDVWFGLGIAGALCLHAWAAWDGARAVNRLHDERRRTV